MFLYVWNLCAKIGFGLKVAFFFVSYRFNRLDVTFIEGPPWSLWKPREKKRYIRLFKVVTAYWQITQFFLLPVKVVFLFNEKNCVDVKNKEYKIVEKLRTLGLSLKRGKRKICGKVVKNYTIDWKWSNRRKNNKSIYDSIALNVLNSILKPV